MTTGSIPLTIIILTHRNDERFKQALASAQPAAEVLVADYDSHNAWPTLAKEFQFKKINHSGPITNFSEERNSVMSQASHDWVLFLDSDEVITTASWPVIKKIIEQDKLAGVLVKRQDMFYAKPLRFGETGNTWILRLVKTSQTKFIRPVHEIAQVTGKTKKANIVLKHFAHLTIAEFLADIVRYANIEAEYQQDYLLSELKLDIKTVAYPKLKFFHNYLLKLGFLDGWQGLVYATLMSLHSVMVRVFSYENR